jgi:hypothetical protein
LSFSLLTFSSASCLSPLSPSDAGPFFSLFSPSPGVELCLAGPLRANARYEIKLSFREPDARVAAALVRRAEPAATSRAPPGSHGAIGGAERIGDSGGGGAATAAAGPETLDAEKIEFRTDGDAHVVLREAPAEGAAPLAVPADLVALRLTATPRGGRGGAGGVGGGVWFRARLDSVRLVPARALPLLVLVPLALAASLVAALAALKSVGAPRAAGRPRD